MVEQRMLEKLRANGKYAGVNEDTLLRVIDQYLPRYKKESDVLDAVKTHLHSVYGAYYPNRCHDRAHALLDTAAELSATQEVQRGFARSILSMHASTAERLPILEEVYAFIFGHLSVQGSVMDLGCGFHPFGWPFMPVNEALVYTACDLSLDTAVLLQRFFTWSGRNGQAMVLDLMAIEQPIEADTVLMMKLLPLLEQQKKDSGVKLLREIKARRIVVTFPTASLSGRRKGMRGYYEKWLDTSIQGVWRCAHNAEIGNELICILEKDG